MKTAMESIPFSNARIPLALSESREPTVYQTLTPGHGRAMPAHAGGIQWWSPRAFRVWGSGMPVTLRP
jgi:hypothetical protein